jgi:predicted phage terminase large subunit-like protein
MYELLSGDLLPPRAELTPKHVRSYLTEVAAEQARRSLRLFCKRGWGKLQPQTPIWNWHVDALCDHLAYVTLGEIRFLMVSMPPRMSKTMICTVEWPAWHWLHEPGEQFLTAGVDDQLARDAAILSRRLIESEWYQTQWPGEIVLYDDENTAGMYRNRKGGYRMIGSLQGRITGVGGTTQILDDPHDAKKVESDTVRHNALAWHDNAWRSRVNNPDTAKKVYVGQRTHDADIFGHVLEQEGSRWCHLILAMEYNPARKCITYLNKGDGKAQDAKPIFEDPRKVEREILDPKRMSAKTVNAEKRIVSEAAWQAQYNQAPTGMGGLILKRHWWRPWVQPEWRPNAGAERPMPRFDTILQVWDTALEEDEMEDADFSACTTWGTFRYTEQYLEKKLHRPADWPADKDVPVAGETRTCMMLLDAVKERYAYPDLRQKAIDLNKEFAPDLILIEKKVSGHSLIQELRRKHLPVKGVKLSGSAGGSGARAGMEGDLVARANSASLMLEKGCVWYPPMPFSYAVMEECSKFPNGDHDDYVSTCVIAWMYARRYYDLQLPDDEKDDVSPWVWKKLPRKRYA